MTRGVSEAGSAESVLGSKLDIYLPAGPDIWRQNESADIRYLVHLGPSFSGH
jgi:hypothetical protein